MYQNNVYLYWNLTDKEKNSEKISRKMYTNVKYIMNLKEISDLMPVAIQYP